MAQQQSTETGWMLLPAAIRDLLLQSAEPSAGQEQLGWLCSFSCSGCLCPPRPCLPCAGQEGTAHRELLTHRVMAVLAKMLKIGAC